LDWSLVIIKLGAVWSKETGAGSESVPRSVGSLLCMVRSVLTQATDVVGIGESGNIYVHDTCRKPLKTGRVGDSI